MNHAHEATDEMSGIAAHRVCVAPSLCDCGENCPPNCMASPNYRPEPKVSRWAALLGYYDAVAWVMALCMLVGVFRG